MGRRLARRAGVRDPRAAARAAPGRVRRRRSRRAASCRRGTARASRVVLPARSSDRSGQASPSARRRNSDPVAPLRERLGPRQPLDAERQHAARQRRARSPRPRDGQRLLGERQRAEPPAAAGAQRSGGAVEGQSRRPSRSSAPATASMSARRQRRGEQDARRGGAADDLADRQIGSPASASCASSAAARPFAIRNSPRLPRAMAMRSG